LKGHLAGGRAVQALVGERWTQRVATNALQALPVPGGYSGDGDPVDGVERRDPIVL
jgi:hypothetical protein